MKLILNRIKTPDGTILTSYHRHDFVTHTDANGQMYGVDGGSSYSRRIGNTNECEDLSVWIDDDKPMDDDKFKIVRESLHWGTRGKDGDQPVRWVKMSEMSDAHLTAMLKYEGPVDSFYKECFSLETEYREKFRISVSE